MEFEALTALPHMPAKSFLTENEFYWCENKKSFSHHGLHYSLPINLQMAYLLKSISFIIKGTSV